MKRKGRTANRAGLVKKKIRGKDGKTRTYWVKKAGSSGGSVPKPAGLSSSATRKAASIAAVAVSTGAGAYALKKVATQLDLGESPVSMEQRRKLEYTPNGLPTEETLRRYDREFQEGDLIRKAFSLGDRDAFHYAIYAGKNRFGGHEAYQVGEPDGGGFPRPYIVKSLLHEPVEGESTTSMYEKVPAEDMGPGAGRFSREEIKVRAEGLVGNAFDYGIVKSNCESLSRLIVEGEHYSTQGRDMGGVMREVVDTVSRAIAKKKTAPGATVVTPEAAAEYLEALSAREGEPFSYSDFLARKGRGDSDGVEIEGVIPLEDILVAAREGGLVGGTFQRKVEEEIISRYLLFLSAQATLAPGATPLVQMDSIPGGKSKVCPGGYKIPATKQCRKGGAKVGTARKAFRQSATAGLKTPGAAAIGAGGLALAAGAALARTKPGRAVTENVKQRVKGAAKAGISKAVDYAAREIETGEHNEFVNAQVKKLAGAAGKRVKREVGNSVKETIRSPGKLLRRGPAKVKTEDDLFVEEQQRKLLKAAAKRGVREAGHELRGSVKARLEKPKADSWAEDRMDAPRKGKKCGKSYIPRAKKCLKGQAEASSGRVGTPGRVAEQDAAGGALEVVQNGKGFLGRIAVNKDEFDWPGNGKTTPELEERYNQFKKGDLIENAFLSQGKYVRHYGVYAGKDPKTGEHQVYQVGRKDEGVGQTIRKESLSARKPIEFSAWRKTPQEEMYQKSNSRVYSRQDIIKRAESTVGKDFHYNVSRSNCEHYARGIVEGKAYSAQMEKVTPLTRIGGDIVSIAVRKRVGKRGLTASEIIRTVNQIEKKQGKSIATRKDLYISNRKDSEALMGNLGDLRSPEEFERIVQEVTGSMPGTAGDLLRVELYTNYLMLITKMTSAADQGEGSRTDAKSRVCPGGYKIPLRKKCKAGRKGRKSSLDQARETMRSALSLPSIQSAALSTVGAIGVTKSSLEAADWVDRSVSKTKKAVEEITSASKEDKEVAKAKAGEAWRTARKSGKPVSESVGGAVSTYIQTLKSAKKEKESDNG